MQRLQFAIIPALHSCLILLKPKSSLCFGKAACQAPGRHVSLNAMQVLLWPNLLHLWMNSAWAATNRKTASLETVSVIAVEVTN